MVGGGDRPVGPRQTEWGDPVPFFELILPPRAAKAAVPVLAAVSLTGIAALVLRRPGLMVRAAPNSGERHPASDGHEPRGMGHASRPVPRPGDSAPQIRQDREDAAMVVGCRQQLELREDVGDVGLDRLRSEEEPSQIAWFERPSAISASTSRSRSVRSSSGTRARRRPTSWATTSGSITEPPRGDPPDRVGEVVEIVDPVLQQVADAAGPVGHEPQREGRLDVLRQDEDPDAVPCSARIACAARRPSSVCVGGIRMSTIATSGRCSRTACQECRRRRRPGRRPRTLPPPAGARSLRGAGRSHRRERRGGSCRPPTSARIAAPDSSSLGMNPRTWLLVRRGP